MSRVIIIAAGRGSRLEGFTDDRPKCMVSIGGKSILDHQLAAFAANGVDDLHIIRGYLADRLVVDGATYHENPTWEQNNILHSLFCARDALSGPLMTTYSDIVFTADVVQDALLAHGDISLVVDTAWRDAYEGRDDHPVEQAELVRVDDTGRITAVGKHVSPEGALGEFIGLAAYSTRGTELLCEHFSALRRELHDDALFRHGRPFRRAYLADLFEVMIERGVSLDAVPIDGGWREIDTVQDLHAVQQAWARVTERPDS
jgi:L-glutamine-phosphate cytidylyltransferase